jgi:hypothetical protein
MSGSVATRTTDDRTAGVDAVDLGRHTGVAFVDGEVYVYDAERETVRRGRRGRGAVSPCRQRDESSVTEYARKMST